MVCGWAGLREWVAAGGWASGGMGKSITSSISPLLVLHSHAKYSEVTLPDEIDWIHNILIFDTLFEPREENTVAYVSFSHTLL